MSSGVLTGHRPVDDDGVVMDASTPRAGGPSRRRSFTPAEKVEHLAGYEAALEAGEAGAYLRRNGLYSSLITEWRRLRDAGMLDGKDAGTRIGRPSKEQTEIARLKRDLAKAEAKLATTETALAIMGKAHALLEQISKSATDEPDERR